MIRPAGFLAILLFICGTVFVLSSSQAADSSSSSPQWKITSVKVCRSSGSALTPSLEAVGNFPVYSFFIPRPVWTVNGTVVEAKPVYEQGRLVSFMLYGGSMLLKSGSKNIIKFSLPDQNGLKAFMFEESRMGPGECYEFF